MKPKLLLLVLFCFSYFSNAQVDFEAHIIVENHPDVFGVYNLTAADIDGDGDIDLVATSTDGNKIVWFENTDGQGNFSAPKVIESDMEYPLEIAVADLNGNGYLDLVAVSTFDNQVVWFENLDGLGNFGPQQTVASLYGAQTVKAKDINGDGYIDIIAGGDNKVIWIENTDGLGNFGTPKIISNAIGTTESIEVGDIDGDGDMDVVVADYDLNTISWYENTDGLGNFGAAQLIHDEVDAALSVVLKDLNNDGNLDVISDYQNGSIAWFENDGQGDFGSANVIGSNLGLIFKLFAADLTGDGNNDIIASEWVQHELVWFQNTGNGNFGNKNVISSAYQNPVGVIAADFNGDGKMDVAACFRGLDQIIWFENKGPLSIANNTSNKFTIYPNPTKDFLNIVATSSISEVKIFNPMGQLVLTAKNTSEIDIAELGKGIYLVYIKTEDNQVGVEKIIKK